MRRTYDEGAYIWVVSSVWDEVVRILLISKVYRSRGKILDVARFKNVTKRGETEGIISKEADKELKVILEKLSTSNQEALVCVVTDSESCNIGAKKIVSERWPRISFLAGYFPQLNLMAGKY